MHAISPQILANTLPLVPGLEGFHCNKTPISLVSQSCLPEDRDNSANNHTCVTIVCEVRQLRSGNRVQVEISAVIDERHLGVSVQFEFGTSHYEMGRP